MDKRFFVVLSGDVNEKDLDFDLPDSAETKVARPDESTRDIMQILLQFTPVRNEEFKMMDKLILNCSIGDAD